jgi:hypothetical protein
MKIFKKYSWQKVLQGLIDDVVKKVLVTEIFYKI